MERNKRKFVTAVSGLEAHGLDLKKVAKEFGYVLFIFISVLFWGEYIKRGRRGNGRKFGECGK